MQTQEVPQHIQALEQANRKKQARTRLKREVAEGSMPVATVIAVAPDVLRTTSNSCNPLTIADILGWQNGWGKTRSEKFLRRRGFSPGLELWQLSDSRRKLLVKELR